MLSYKDAQIVGNYFYQIDKKCRDDLSKRLIISERDYVSRFTTFAMYPNGPFKKSPIFWLAKTLPQPLETKFGCDGVIVFKKGNVVKIGMFEAKWPRMDKSSKTPWDDNKKKKLDSRFTSELEKQKYIYPQVAIWEMFFNDLNVGVAKKGFDSEASACIWHDLALHYKNKRIGPGEIWSNRKKKHLETMLRYRNFLKSASNLEDILIDILMCKKGIPVNIKSNESVIIPIGKGSSDTYKIPLPDPDSANIEKITDFMKDNGFRQYAFIDLDDLLVFLNDELKSKKAPTPRGASRLS